MEKGNVPSWGRRSPKKGLGNFTIEEIVGPSYVMFPIFGGAFVYPATVTAIRPVPSAISCRFFLFKLWRKC